VARVFLPNAPAVALNFWVPNGALLQCTGTRSPKESLPAELRTRKNLFEMDIHCFNWRRPRLVASTGVLLVLLFPQFLRSQSTVSSPSSSDDRPQMKHQTDRVSDYGLPKEGSPGEETDRKASSGPLVAPGLNLPSMGRVWALDTFQGRPELVRLKYSTVDLNNHTASNILKTQAVPLF
jgi:hypothetical protein